MASETSSTRGATFPWILEHLLAHPNTYEIPLRTMYTSNVLAQSTHQSQPGTPALSSNGSSTNNSPVSPQTPHFAPPAHRLSTKQAAADHFKSCLMEQISYQPCQPFSLPPSFITSFVRRCFTEDLCLVDFTQALTALDYLKDLETRRKRELAAALLRLGINRESFNNDSSDLRRSYPGVAEWVSIMEDRERKVEALYTQVYIGLRRWTLINEMRLEPFNKANCIAMLNTLYPPSITSLPTQQLTAKILEAQRTAFFRYIQSVEQNGKRVLLNLEMQSRRDQDENGWPVVREIVDKYLRTANSFIEECFSVTVDAFRKDVVENRKAGRRADSGISFISGDRPSTSSSLPLHEEKSINKPLPTTPRPDSDTKRGATTLERIAREIRRMKSRSGESKESDMKQEHSERSLKKMKSTNTLGRVASSKSLGKHSRANSGDRMQSWEVDEAQREKLLTEAKALREKEREKEKKVPKPAAKEVKWAGLVRGGTA